MVCQKRVKKWAGRYGGQEFVAVCPHWLFYRWGSSGFFCAKVVDICHEDSVFDPFLENESVPRKRKAIAVFFYEQILLFGSTERG